MEQAYKQSRESAPCAWLPHGDPDSAAAIRLFCFYYAGGNTAVFREWSSLLPSSIQVCPVELAGHGTRMRDAPSRSMKEIIDGLELALAPWLTMPFAFFGHSMGAALAFELAHRVRVSLGVQPECLFVSGRRAPGRSQPAPIHDLPRQQFIEEIRRLSGTPEELLAHPEILTVLLPMLRADFAVIETCERVDRAPLDCPIVAFGGWEDPRVSRDDVHAWRDLTRAQFSLEMLPGDHFFLNRSRAPLVQIIAAHLTRKDVPDDIIDQFEQRAAHTPAAVALVANADVLTYRELNQRANKLARYMRQLGVGAETRVALCLGRNAGMLTAILAVLKAGGAYVPLDPDWPSERALWILQQSNCSVLISGKGVTLALDDVPIERVDLEQCRQLIDACSCDNLQRIAQPDNAAYVIYTSGSTGRPKGVLITRSSVANLFRCTEGLFDFGATDVWSMCHSYAFDYSVWEMWGAWLSGGRLVLASRVEAQSPEQLYELLEREGVTVLSQTPSSFRALLQEVQRVPSRSLHARTLVFGGEALDPSLLLNLHVRHPGKNLINMYGITETTVHSTYKRLLAEDMRGGGRSPIGVELPGLRIYVLDGDFCEVGVGESGEIFIAGPSLARSYLDNAALTAERFMPELDGPLRKAGERMYRTGDLARRMPNAELEYLGRCDQQVKLRGYRIELGEIESSLRGLSGVREACVMLDQEAEQPRLVAYVFREAQTDLAASALREELSKRLPSYMVPAAFVILDAIPLTVNGKLDKKALPKVGTERPVQKETYAAPKTQLEQSIAAIWADALRIESVGVRDNFFDLGGHSLLLIQVQERLREELGLSIPVVELFARPNISLLAEFAAGEPAESMSIAARGDSSERHRSLRRRREARRATRVLEDGEVGQ